jgi:hypothetical protein
MRELYKGVLIKIDKPAPWIIVKSRLDLLLQEQSTQVQGDDGYLYFVPPGSLFIQTPQEGDRVIFQIDKELAHDNVKIAYKVYLENEYSGPGIFWT